MHNFKIGNTVRRIAGYHSGMSKGDSAKISGFHGPDLYLEGYGDSTHTWSNFELVQDEKESISKFLKENKWWIKCSSQSELDVLNLWLIDHFGYSLDIPAPKNMQYVCNDSDYTNEVFWGYGNSDSKGAEIKLEFETIIKNVQLPEITPKKTEAQLKLEELQKIVEDAQQKIAELKEEIK